MKLKIVQYIELCKINLMKKVCKLIILNFKKMIFIFRIPKYKF